MHTDRSTAPRRPVRPIAGGKPKEAGPAGDPACARRQAPALPTPALRPASADASATTPVDRTAGPVDRCIAAGTALYDRRRMLPRLLPIAGGDLEAVDEAALRRICARLARALRSERARGRAGHWSYDLNRHIGLLQAFRAERLHLARVETATGRGPAGHAPRPSSRAEAGA